LNPLRGWQRWVGFLSTKEDAAALACARMISGSTIAWNLFSMASSGAAFEAWVDLGSGGARNSFAPMFAPFGGCTYRNVHTLIAIGCIAGVLMAIGFATRLSTLVTWFSFMTLTNINYLAGGSADDLLLNGLFVLLLSGCGRTLSVDQWLRRRRDPAASSEAPAWPRWVLIFQIVTVYWTTGMQKVSASWWPPPFGTLDAIWYILQQPTWIRFTTLEWATPLFRLTQLASLGTWLLENSAPVLLIAFWYRFTRERPGRVRAFFNAPLRPLRRWLGPGVETLDYRLCYLAAGFSMHLGIFLLMEVGPFFNSVLVCYACCITPAEWRAVIAWLRGKLRPAPVTAPASP
jgi:hypothetical protein